MLREALVSSLEVIAINDVMPIEMAVYLFKYDSVYGVYAKDVSYDKNILIVGNKRIVYSAFLDNTQNDFSKADIILECSGHYRSLLQNTHYGKKVIISAPTKDNTKTFIYGVNHHEYNNESIISASSCTANATAPVIGLLEKSYGVLQGSITVIHGYTSDQSLLDGQNKAEGRRGRASDINMLPLRSSVASEVQSLYPHIPLAGINVRVPVDNAMMLVLNLALKESICDNALDTLLQKAQSSILCYERTPLVSGDIKNYRHSAVIDASQCYVNGSLVAISLFQDNERAYASRLLDLAAFIGR